MVTHVDPKYKYYLHDLGFLLKERALEAKQDMEEARDHKGMDSGDYIFQAGRLLAYNEVVSILQQQARGFDIDLQELNLEDIDPDRDLL